MTAFQQKSFSVPLSSRDPTTCPHGWYDRRDRCVYCGIALETVLRLAEDRGKP